MRKLSSIFFALLITASSAAQINYEPLYKNIYDYLENISIKGIIKYNDEVRPLSRTYIAKKLVDISNKKDKLNKLEIEELEFYIKDYCDEIHEFGYGQSGNSMHSSHTAAENDTTIRNDLLRFGNTGRLRLYSYHDQLFTINVDPILGYTIGSMNGASYLHRWNGAKVLGKIGSNFGFSLDFRDNLEDGKNADKKRFISPESGINILKGTNNSVEYSEVRGNISYGWNWGAFTLCKDFQNWGSGKNGLLILSGKAPSFPMIRLEVSPVDWFRFTYIHGWLSSEVLDSSTIRKTLISDTRFKNGTAFSEIEKYIVAHLISFDLKDNLTMSLGESVVYSDKLLPIYFIPVLFFRLADHYQMDKGNTGANAQIFANLYYNFSSVRAKLYSTLFIDDLSIEGLLKNETSNSAIGYTLGSKFVDPVIRNSSLVVEYTHISPFVYMNSDPAQLFTSHGYQLGHWIGSNGYNVYSSYNQKILRGFSLTLSGELVKKGQKELPQQQYELPYPSFLYGAKYEEKSASIELSYEYIHDFFVKLNYKYTDISDEDKTRTPSYMLGKHHSFGISLYYGM